MAKRELDSPYAQKVKALREQRTSLRANSDVEGSWSKSDLTFPTSQEKSTSDLSCSASDYLSPKEQAILGSNYAARLLKARQALAQKQAERDSQRQSRASGIESDHLGYESNEAEPHYRSNTGDESNVVVPRYRRGASSLYIRRGVSGKHLSKKTHDQHDQAEVGTGLSSDSASVSSFATKEPWRLKKQIAMDSEEHISSFGLVESNSKLQAQSVDDAIASFGDYSFANLEQAQDVFEHSASFGHISEFSESSPPRKRAYSRKQEESSIESSSASFGDLVSKRELKQRRAKSKVKTSQSNLEQANASVIGLGIGIGNEADVSATTKPKSYKRSWVRKRDESGADELDNDSQHAFDYLVYLLTQREHSVKELKDKALARFTQEAFDKALERCVDLGYQSDMRYAQMLVKHMVFALYGPMRLSAESFKKGVERALIDQAVEVLEVDWDEICFQAALKKYGRIKMEYKERTKAYAYLARRGFENSSCILALERLQNSEESLYNDGLS